MRTRLPGFPIALATASLCACAGMPTKPDDSKPTMHVDLVYDQFVLSADGKSPYDLTSLQNVPAACGAAAAPPRAGGVAILASLATSLAGAAASAIVSELQKWVNAEIAEYSWESTGKPVRVGFYDAKRWFSVPGDAARYSCFIVALNSCEASQVDTDRNVCPAVGADTRVLIVGQYKLTGEDLQIRPLFGRVKGFEAKRNPTEKEVSIAATLNFESIWWDGHEGHREAPVTANVLSLKFVPTSGGPSDPGIDLPVQHKDPVHGGYAFADWESQPLLQRPPESAGSDGTASITPTIAEANSPPKGWVLVQKTLSSNSSQISSALKSALQSLVPK